MFRGVALAVALVASLGGCSDAPSQNGSDESFPSEVYASAASATGALHVDVRTAPTQPPPRGTCTVELTVTDAHGAPVDQLGVDVVPWMPAMGHGASVMPSVSPRGHGKSVVT